jgi:hypothetical protein
MNFIFGLSAMNLYLSGRFMRSALLLLAAILLTASFAVHADEASDHEDLEKMRATVQGLVDVMVKNGVLPRDKADAMLREAEWRAIVKLAEVQPSKDAEDLERMRATLQGLVEVLVKNGVITRDKADAMLREAEWRAIVKLAEMPPPEAGTDGKKIVRVPYVPEAVKVQMHDQIKAEVLAETRNERASGADWPSRIQLGGDLRLRVETTRLDNGNTPAADYFNNNSYLTRAADIWGNTSNGVHNFNTQEDTRRTRLRARLSVIATVSEAVSAGLGLSTGSSTTAPTSTNQTMGQGSTQSPGFFIRDSVVLDLAYIKYEPESWLSMSGGRMRNPFFSTDLIWADDLNFEGFAVTFKPRMNLSSTAFFTGGWFPLSTSVPNQTSGRSLGAAQAGFDWQIGQKDNRIKLAASVYDYHGIEGIKETQDYNLLNGMGPTDYGVRSEYAANYRQRGNTLFRLNSINDPNYPGYLGLASSFREL